jgi:hypothetical protein
MADEFVCQIFSENPDPQEKPVSRKDITSFQERHIPPDRLSQCIIEWLASKFISV